jgi:glyoxalase family protein
MTFFPWPGVGRGSVGSGQTETTVFAIPKCSLEFWRTRLHDSLIRAEHVERFGVPGLALADPDGLRLELVAGAERGDDRQPWDGSSVPAEHAIRGFHSVTLMHADPTATEDLLVGTMGFRKVAADGPRARYESGEGGSGAFVDLLHDPDAPSGRVAGGSVHHIAFRLANDDAQSQWMDRLLDAGHRTTEVKDRMYFHSIYLREPGGVLFELATDTPGFTADETEADLGSELRLPPWFESARDRIESALPELEIPASETTDEAA